VTDETTEDRLERYRVEGAADFIDGIIKGARDQDDAGMLLCAENAEKALRCLRVDKARLRAELAHLGQLAKEDHDDLQAKLAARDQRIAELESASTTWREDACRLSGGLIAIRNAAPTVPASVLRGIAYDIALNCINPDTAEFQIETRTAKEAAGG
jgi:hypothetical protein